MDEPNIVINGVTLSLGQAMALRVAASNFQMELHEPQFMDELGPIGPAYLARLNEILQIMLKR